MAAHAVSPSEARPAPFCALLVPSTGFHITMWPDEVEPVIHVSGDLDTRGASLFDRAYDAATDRAPQRVVVDLSHMNFIDSNGLRSIVRARARSADRSSFVLRAPQAEPLRLLELSGLLDEFTIEPRCSETEAE